MLFCRFSRAAIMCDVKNMYVRECVYVHIYMYIETKRNFDHVYMRVFVIMCTSGYACRHLHECIFQDHIGVLCVYMLTYIHTYIYACRHTHERIHEDHIGGYVRTYVHTYTHTCIHAYIPYIPGSLYITPQHQLHHRSHQQGICAD
jgi:hypothetical protein